MAADLSDTLSELRSYPSAGLSEADRSLVTKIRSAAGVLQASLATHGAVRYQIPQFEKLLCDLWMEDQRLLERLYASWGRFRSQYEREIGAMTVNERLVHLGLMDDFERASGHPERLRTVLGAALLSPPDIEAIIQRNTD